MFFVCTPTVDKTNIIYVNSHDVKRMVWNQGDTGEDSWTEITMVDGNVMHVIETPQQLFDHRLP